MKTQEAEPVERKYHDPDDPTGATIAYMAAALLIGTAVLIGLVVLMHVYA